MTLKLQLHPVADTDPLTQIALTPTEWSSVEEKAKFANHLLKFIAEGYKETQFHTWFYKRLSMCFGFIAHYNREGFYGTYFTSPEGQLRFLDCLERGGGFGDPAFTYSDVERIIKARLRSCSLKEDLVNRIQLVHEHKERTELARLQAKYPAPRGPVTEGPLLGRTITVRRRA